MADVNLKIVIEEDRRADIDRIEADLKEKGFDVRASIPEFRTIIGSGDSAILDHFRGVEGVQTVRPEGRFQLPPMDEDIPQ